MHEMSIAVNIVELALEELRVAGGTSVFSLELDVGILSGVSISALTFVWPFAVQDGPLHNAVLKINPISLEMRCHLCSGITHCDDITLMCGLCHSTQVAIISGKDLFIRRMEIR